MNHTTTHDVSVTRLRYRTGMMLYGIKASRWLMLPSFLFFFSTLAMAAEPTWAAATEATEQRLRLQLTTAIAAGKSVALAANILGAPDEARVDVVGASGPTMVTKQGLSLPIEWKKLLPAGWITISRLNGPPTPVARHDLVRFLIQHGWLAEAEHELAQIGTGAIDETLWRETLSTFAAARKAATPAPTASRLPVGKDSARINKAEAAKASFAQSNVLRRLGRDHFLFGISSQPHDDWLTEVRSQGAGLSVRYQYICGGVNTPSNWKTWNSPAGAFAASYIAETPPDVIPMFTYYQIRQSAPGGADEAGAVRGNSANPATMRAYFDDWDVLMQVAGKAGRPVIVHWEPDFSGYVQAAPEFGHDPAKIPMAVASSGHPAAIGAPNNFIGLCATLVKLRDQSASNVVLAFHLSNWGFGGGQGQAAGAFLTTLGKGWDLVATDCSDRDSAWRIVKGYHVGDAWWDNSGFDNFRHWCADVHASSGLPVLLWQVPIGNTIMATCNDSECHFQDNRAQYFLEGFPRNRNLQAWAESGVIGICFGAGIGGCTVTSDSAKDGITNPTPAKGNKGEKSTVADDDGGYLRTRLISYTKAGGLPFLLMRTRP